MFFRVNSDVECLCKPTPDSGAGCSATSRPPPHAADPSSGWLQYEPVDRIQAGAASQGRACRTDVNVGARWTTAKSARRSCGRCSRRSNTWWRRPSPARRSRGGSSRTWSGNAAVRCRTATFPTSSPGRSPSRPRTSSRPSDWASASTGASSRRSPRSSTTSSPDCGSSRSGVPGRSAGSPDAAWPTTVCRRNCCSSRSRSWRTRRTGPAPADGEGSRSAADGPSAQ